MITVFASALAVLAMVVTGLALFLRLAPYLLADRQNEVPETDLLMLGVLPGLALVGTAATYLAVLHLLRVGVAVFFAIAILTVCHREVRGMFVQLGRQIREWFVQAGQANFFPLIAAGAFLGALIMSLLLCVVPSENMDIWAFHVPLAQSYVAHHGFVFPQIDSLLYATQPGFQEILFSVAMMAVPNFVAAGAVNVAVFFGFLLILPTFARHARAIHFLAVFLVFFWWQSFSLSASEPMGDLSRSCFSVGAYLFAYRYAVSFRRFDLAICALLAGAAVASKYTELMTPALIFVTVAPLMIRKDKAWTHILLAAGVFLATAGLWYVRNAIALGNPVFPFVFGHPGFSNQYMADYTREMTQAFTPADRIYSTNLLSVKGWHDFATVLNKYFAYLIAPALIAAIGLLLPQRRRWMLPLWSIVLFAVWYAVMFNGLRWAMSAVLMLLCAAFMTWVWTWDRIAAAWNPQWSKRTIEALSRKLCSLADPGIALISIAFAFFLATAAPPLPLRYGHLLLPQWMSHDFFMALINPGRMDRYMAEAHPGYALYRYIGQHDLKMVMQPFDLGAPYYVSMYNGGHQNDWVLHNKILPASAAETDAFVARNNIRYFVDKDPIGAVDADRIGAHQIALAKDVFARLKPRSRLILRNNDMYLYEILPAP